MIDITRKQRRSKETSFSLRLDGVVFSSERQWQGLRWGARPTHDAHAEFEAS